jgi:hypothetical protein
MAKVIMNNGFGGPFLYIKDLGKISIPYFTLDDSEFYQDVANSLYDSKELPGLYKEIDLNDEKLERIISLAKRKKEVESDFKKTQKEIVSARKEMREELEKYGLIVPTILRGEGDEPRIIW